MRVRIRALLANSGVEAVGYREALTQAGRGGVSTAGYVGVASHMTKRSGR